MARLNYCNVLCHFSHSGCDDMADNSCHFGLNNFFADNGLEEQQASSLYFPADSLQLEKVVDAVFWDQGLRFLYTTRSKVPLIQREDGSNFFGEGYRSPPSQPSPAPPPAAPPRICSARLPCAPAARGRGPAGLDSSIVSALSGRSRLLAAKSRGALPAPSSLGLRCARVLRLLSERVIGGVVMVVVGWGGWSASCEARTT